MKKKFVFFALTLITSTLSFAQMKEGHIAYEIEVTSDNPDMEMAVMMFNGSKMNLYFGESHGRTDLEMGTMMSTTTVVNNNSGEVLILMGGIIGEKAVKTTTDVMEAETEEDAIPEADIKFTKEKKIIAGMQCKKAIITDASREEIVCWYTEEIPTTATDNKSIIAQLPGQALEYAVNNNGMVMRFVAVKVETSLSDEDKKKMFNMDVPEGFVEMTYEEFTSQGGGM